MAATKRSKRTIGIKGFDGAPVNLPLFRDEQRKENLSRYRTCRIIKVQYIMSDEFRSVEK